MIFLTEAAYEVGIEARLLLDENNIYDIVV